MNSVQNPAYDPGLEVRFAAAARHSRMVRTLRVAVPAAVVLIFLGVYNAGHLALRACGLRVGWEGGMRVAQALANPVLRQGPQYIGRAAALLAGVAIPLAMHRIIGPGRTLLGGVLAVVIVGAVVLARLHGRVEGWRIALGVLAAFVLFSVLRHG